MGATVMKKLSCLGLARRAALNIVLVLGALTLSGCSRDRVVASLAGVAQGLFGGGVPQQALVPARTGPLTSPLSGGLPGAPGATGTGPVAGLTGARPIPGVLPGSL